MDNKTLKQELDSYGFSSYEFEINLQQGCELTITLNARQYNMFRKSIQNIDYLIDKAEINAMYRMSGLANSAPKLSIVNHGNVLIIRGSIIKVLILLQLLFKYSNN